MKKFLAVLLIAIMAFSFAACGGVEGGTETSTNQGGEPSQETSGNQSTEPTTPTHEHTFEEGWTTDAYYHWHKATCEHGDEVSDKAKHSFGEDGICTACGMKELTSSEGLEYTLNDDDKSYSVTGIGTCKDTDIVISATYEGKPVTSVGNRAFRECGDLTSVHIPDGVTSIGDSAFGGCFALTSVTMPDSVTAIGVTAFGGCACLTGISIPNGVTNIGIGAFNGCTGLTNVTIPNGVTSIEESVFAACEGLSSVTIPEGVISIGITAFAGCKKLTTIIIPNSVTSIAPGAFALCTSLESITIPNGVTSIDEWVFDACSSLTSIKIPNSVTSIGANAFRECERLESITIPMEVKSIGNFAFIDCTGLTSIVIPDSVTNIDRSAFCGCTGLTSATIGNGVTSIGEHAFYDCKELVSITYNGTKSQWEEISKGSSWDANTGTYTVHCTDSTGTTTEETTGTTTEETTGPVIEEPIVVTKAGITNLSAIKKFEDVPEITPENKAAMRYYIEEYHNPGVILYDFYLIKRKVVLNSGVVNREGVDYPYSFIEFDTNYNPPKTTCPVVKNFTMHIERNEYDIITKLLDDYYDDKITETDEGRGRDLSVLGFKLEELDKILNLIHTVSYSNNSMYQYYVDTYYAENGLAK